MIFLPNKEQSDTGFTLIELLVVIAIIGILSSVVLASLSGARESARDTKRVQDFRQLRTAIQMHLTSEGEYPAKNLTDSRLSSECDSIKIYTDLVDDGYLSEMPSDPIGDIEHCSELYGGGSTSPEVTNEDFFYGWDAFNGGGDRRYCISINQFESYDSGESPIAGYNEQLSNGFGPDANMDGADFVSCFEDY